MKGFEERYVLKDDLSIIKVTRWIWSGFDECIEY